MTSSRKRPSSRKPAGETRELVFRFVRDRCLSGDAPTVREVQSHFGFRAVQSAREHLERLVEEGRLGKHQGRARGYYLPGQESASVVQVPLLGRVHAGDLHAAIEWVEGSVFFERGSAFERGRRVEGGARSASEYFALRVDGDSMIGAGILDGDLVIVRAQSTAQSGDIVVASIEGEHEREATVKRLRRQGRRIELHPENPDYDVIVPTGKSGCTILGKVVEVRRRL
ncbi:MAG: transcriptional repressor LexA [Planctomycetes bacterium]|nr:transcriptional repressor LexA [Planctomycetota bacterium]